MNIMLCGIPGSGKSTIVKSLPSFVLISTDDTREKLYGSASEQGNWGEVWADICLQFQNAQNLNLPIVYDACNLTREHRASVLNAFKGPWQAFVFNDDPWECWKRNNRRERIVPGYAFNAMVAMWEYPTLDEGFDQIVPISYKPAMI